MAEKWLNNIMNEEKKVIVRNIVDIPRKFNSLGNVSTFTLLKESGYFQTHSEIDQNDIYEILLTYPNHVDEWLELSENKRSLSGWYLRKSETGAAEVGCYSHKNGCHDAQKYSDITLACAAFIKSEIEEIRNNKNN